ncbi:MAG: hypothetical protein KAI70_07255 [Candidatus Omnitrophica bacterium]|nr:hypothetical protein [Candidatus Omnitrophota bacterium]
MREKFFMMNAIIFCVCLIVADVGYAGVLPVLNSKGVKEDVEEDVKEDVKQEEIVKEEEPWVEEDFIDKKFVDLRIRKAKLEGNTIKVQVYNYHEDGPVLKNIQVSYYVWEEKFGGYGDAGYKRKKIGDSYIPELTSGVFHHEETSMELKYRDKNKEIEVVINEDKVISENNIHNNKSTAGVVRMRKHDTVFHQDLALKDVEIEYGEQL